MSPMSLLLAQSRYGAINNGTWGEESTWMMLWEIPADLAPSLTGWVNVATGKPVQHIYCNKDMAPALEEAIRNVVSRGLASQLKTFDGCFRIRDVRGFPGILSAHSYGGAIDINAATNGLGQAGDMSAELVECFTDACFYWGGRFKRRDGMHMSFLGW